MTLEDDSVKILEANDLVFIDKLKMALEGMPGQNRIGEDGKPKCKNFCSINGRYLKYEPIYVFRKK